MNIQVQFRDEGSSEGVPFAEVPFRREAIDGVIPLVQAWGLSKQTDGEDIQLEPVSLFGQFRILADRVVFEVVYPE
jgi:hypothetical protein